MVITKELNSKVRIVMEQIPYVQSVAIGIWVRAGAVDEDHTYAGISHFIEHMMFKGTAQRSARQIAEDIDRIGGQINAFTGKEATCYYVKTINSNYRQAADVLVDMLTGSLFEREEMNRERQVICEEIKMTRDTPDDLAHETVTSMLFKGSPLGKSVIGTPSSLKKISRNVIKRYFDSKYTRDHIVISVAGNFNPDELCAYFDDKLSELAPAREDASFTASVYTPASKVITKEIEQTHICLAAKGIPLGDDRYYAFSILNNILGGSMSSRLFQNIRERRGLAYSVYSMMGCFSTDGYFNIYAGVSHDKAGDAISGIRHELAELAEKGVTERELDSSREQLKASYIFGQENAAGRMFRNGKNTILGIPLLEPEEVIAGFDAVTMADIEAVKPIICDFSAYSAAAVTGHKFDLKRMMGR